MASAPCFSPATPSALVLGLSDGEDDDEEATPQDGGGSGALQDLSTTPSSDSGSGSLEARRTPPRVLKRSLRTELLERWPGWRSPARKRLRAASPDLPDLPDPVTAAALSSALGWSMTSASTPPTGACDRFWKLVEKIASQPSLLERAEDCERLCVEEAAEDGAEETAASTPPARPAGPRHSPRSSPSTSPSPPQSPPQSPPPSPGQSPPRSPHRSADSSRRSSPAARRKPDRRDTSARTLTAPLSTWVGDDPTLLQTVILAVPDDQDDDLEPPPAASLSPGQGEPATPPTAVEAIHLADGQDDVHEARRPARELLERLQLLEGQPAAAEPDKPDVEEDSSVLQLLVLTPTEERKFGEAPRRACLQTAAATTSKCKTALGVLLRLRIPFFIIALGIVQVTLYAAPSQYVAQEMKNRFVWDKARLFKEPWRAMSYAMLHSGQMHVGLNVGVQSFVGAPLEREQSALRVAAVFFGGAIYGALVTGVVSPTLHMVGASAGIYAILMSHLAQILLNSDAVRYPKTRAGAVLLLTGADMAYTAHHAIQRGNAAPRIGVTAHCAGALSGVFLGLAFYRATPTSLAGLARAHPSYLSYFCYCCHRRCALSSLQVCSGITMAAGVLFCLIWIYFDKPGEGLGLSF